MVLCAMIKWLRDVTGIRSIEELNDFAEDLLPATLLLLVVVIPAYFFVRYIRNRSGIFTGTFQKHDRAANRWQGKRSARTDYHRVPSDVRPMLEYWRQSVIDGQRMTLSSRDVEDFGFSIETDVISRGQIEADLARQVKRRHEELNPRAEIASSSPEHQRFGVPGGGVEVFIAPVVFRRSAPKGIADADLPDILIPFWAPAGLSPDGELFTPRNAYPWVPREYLDPVLTDSGIVVGNIDDLEEFEARNAIERGKPWPNYWRHCQQLFAAVCGDSVRNFSVDGYERRPQGTLVIDISGFGGNNKIERLYNDVLAGRCKVGLARQLTNLREPKRRPITSRPTLAGKAPRLHCGQFESSYPLFPSQREAVHQTLLLKDDEILAVTGPPGTGKTTLIQSVVASMWANAARLNKPYPPLVVSCSATNQATMNVIHSFAKATTGSGPLAGRWLPEFTSFGIFCCSETKSREVRDIPFTLVDGSGTLAQFESEDYLAQARSYYLDRFTAAFSRAGKIATALRVLRKEMKKEQDALFKQVLQHAKAPEQEQRKVLEKLDTTHRHRSFQLATHYWEGKWLLEAPRLLSSLQLQNRRGRIRYEAAHWQIRSMLAPCFVATFSMAPDYFGGHVAEKEPPIDLLITDEASQVNPELAGAIFALAKKALVIGDPAQLEPVWNIPHYADLGNLERFGLIKAGAKDQATVFDSLGMLASSGSLMKRALSACVVGDEQGPGIFLSEHRRSVPRIVEFANELCYKQRLEAKRPEIQQRLFPAFGYAHVRGFCANVGKSKMNRHEAETIAKWLADEQENIEQYYQKPIAEVVAVITPFTAQKRMLRNTVQKKFPAMTVGTANALQGAERAVVIFSPVYDPSQMRSPIFDKKPNLLNVAVTRAQDSFLVFGEMSIFRLEGDSPSSTLARYLLSGPENELTNIEPPPLPDADARDVSHLTTLGSHREALVRALRSAKNYVLIVSPTISAYAIEADRLEQEIEDARKRGVKVIVYTDENLDFSQEEKQLRKPASDGRAMIVRAGADLFVADRIHLKSLAVDDYEIIDGSFNWLSAVRLQGSRNQKHEVSVRCVGDYAKNRIRDLRSELEQRVKVRHRAPEPENTAQNIA